jgi:ribulose-5-phosphate 4-epimerase/fuculose-1-phosphate aldolase
MPGTSNLARAVQQALGARGQAVLMQNHGLVAVGATLRLAANLTAVIERCAELILRCLALGKQPPTLPLEAVEQLQKKGYLTA